MSKKQTQSEIGHIGFNDHRFRGHSVLQELIHQLDPLDATWLGITGRVLTIEDKKVLSWMTTAALAADARVWPLKIARVLSSYGNPYAGFYGSQLATPSDRIGAGSLSKASEALQFILQTLNSQEKQINDQNVEPILLKYLEAHSILNGFGVPFREQDERLQAFQQKFNGHPHEQRPYWQLTTVLIRLMYNIKSVKPNFGIALAALFLDMGISAELTPFVCSLIILNPCFSSHSIEATKQDFRHWNHIPDIIYKGKPRRVLGDSISSD